MHQLAIAFLLALVPVSASAYDGTWYAADYWPGEYPNGFSVVAGNVVLNGRADPDPDAQATIACAVPRRAVFHPWNAKRETEFRTYAKIMPLTVEKEFTYEFYTQDQSAAKRTLLPGDKLEYLIYWAEGTFLVRYKGEELSASQDLLDLLAPIDNTGFEDHEWARITCSDGKKAWILYSDLRDTQGNWIAGIGDPNITGYGSAEDLAE